MHLVDIADVIIFLSLDLLTLSFIMFILVMESYMKRARIDLDVVVDNATELDVDPTPRLDSSIVIVDHSKRIKTTINDVPDTILFMIMMFQDVTEIGIIQDVNKTLTVDLHHSFVQVNKRFRQLCKSKNWLTLTSQQLLCTSPTMATSTLKIFNMINQVNLHKMEHLTSYQIKANSLEDVANIMKHLKTLNHAPNKLINVDIVVSSTNGIYEWYRRLVSRQVSNENKSLSPPTTVELQDSYNFYDFLKTYKSLSRFTLQSPMSHDECTHDAFESPLCNVGEFIRFTEMAHLLALEIKKCDRRCGCSWSNTSSGTGTSPHHNYIVTFEFLSCKERNRGIDYQHRRDVERGVYRYAHRIYDDSYYVARKMID